LIMPFEWSGEMWRAAAISMLDILEVLYTCGYTHVSPKAAWILFDGPVPRLASVEGIVARSSVSPQHVLGIFLHEFVFPLLLFSSGNGILVRHLLRSALPRPSILCRAIVPPDLAGEAKSACKLDFMHGVKALKLFISSIAICRPDSSWATYGGHSQTVSDCSTWTPKQRLVADVLARVRPGSVLDLAANKGWFSRLAARLGAAVIAADND